MQTRFSYGHDISEPISLRFLQIRPELQNVMCVFEFVVLEFIEIVHVRILLSLLAFVPYSLDQIVSTFSLLYFADEGVCSTTLFELDSVLFENSFVFQANGCGACSLPG